MDLEAIDRRRGELKGNRGNWESTWQDIADRVLPLASDFNTTRHDGARRTEKMFDATAALAAQKAVAAFSSFLWPSNQRYQGITCNNAALNKIHRVKAYFEAVTEKLFASRYSTRAAFESQIGEAALQWMVFGTGLMFIDDDMKRAALRYKSLHLGNTYLIENSAGMVDTVFRCWRWSLRQTQQWIDGQRKAGRAVNDMPAKLVERMAKHPDEMIEVAQFVGPREDADPSRLGFRGWPWASAYWIPSEKHLLQEGGFRSWPFAVLRYMTTPGEVYGRSPAWMALSNIKVLNAQKKTVLQAGQKIVDPPLLLTEDGVLSQFSMQPGALNYGGLSSTGEQMVKPLITGARVDIGLDMMDKEREIISGSFFIDVFRALVENPQMTATQALELMQERARIMSPIGGRIEAEGLGPMTERELELLANAGQLPEMPPELIEAQGEYKIEYTSPMRRAMRAGDALAISRTLEQLTPLAQIDPSVLDSFDPDLTARELAEINGVPVKVLRSPEDVKAMKEGRASQQQAAQLIEAAPSVSSAAVNLTKLQQAGGMPVL